MIWHLLDIFFVIFHTFLIFFNFFGWIWKWTRKLNLIVLSLTGASWLFLGLIVGTLGYCPLTDWHFRVLEKLGKKDLPDSYIKYLADRLTGLDFNAAVVDKVTLWVFVLAFALSVFFNVTLFTSARHASHHNQSLRFFCLVTFVFYFLFL
jgi:hypothetical protein